MRALEFWKAVTLDHSDFLESILAILSENRIQYCVIGGQAVNAYAEPVVSLDLDLVVAVDQLERLRGILESRFQVVEFPHSWNVSQRGSDLRVQIQTDPRYFAFPERAGYREVLGRRLSVADIADVLQGKIWAVSDPSRRASKRQKDLADIARLIEVRPELTDEVPDAVRSRLL